jgi:hypothetical protein
LSRVISFGVGVTSTARRLSKRHHARLASGTCSARTAFSVAELDDAHTPTLQPRTGPGNRKTVPLAQISRRRGCRTRHLMRFVRGARQRQKHPEAQEGIGLRRTAGNNPAWTTRLLAWLTRDRSFASQSRTSSPLHPARMAHWLPRRGGSPGRIEWQRLAAHQGAAHRH